METKHKISWMAQRYENEKDNIHLQIGLAFILGCILLGTIIAKNYLLSIIIIISTVLLKHIKKTESEFIPIDIDNNGISVNNYIVNYSRISAFCIDEYEDVNYLLFKLKNTLINPTRVIVIEPEVEISELRKFLLKHVSEKKIKQSSTDKIINAF